MSKLLKNKGFTLIELMIVIVIIGILAALAIPRYMTASAKAKMGEVPTILAGYETAQLASIAEKGVLGTAGFINFDIPTSKWFTYADGTIAATGVAGSFAATATTTVGDFPNAGVVATSVVLAGTISHAVTAGPATTAMTKYCPNF